MLLWGVIAPQIGLKTINYAQAMLVTITIWLVVAADCGGERKNRSGRLTAALN